MNLPPNPDAIKLNNLSIETLGRDLGSPPIRHEKRHYRTVFISDLHLGTRGCNAEALLDFLRSISCDKLYLVGDIVDGWQLKKKWYWPKLHNDVVQKILRKARKETDIVYIPGNHDEFLMQFLGHNFGGYQYRTKRYSSNRGRS